MTTISIFNANYLPVQMTVNNGTQFSIAAAAGPNWVPQSPTSGAPTWSNTTPAQNVIAPGTNTLNITPSGSITPIVATMVLSQSVMWTSFQLYIFFNSMQDASWIVLNNGNYVTGDIFLASAQPKATKA